MKCKYNCFVTTESVQELPTEIFESVIILVLRSNPTTHPETKDTSCTILTWPTNPSAITQLLSQSNTKEAHNQSHSTKDVSILTPQPPIVRAEIAEDEQQTPIILVAEDDPMLQKLMSVRLQKMGFRVVVVSSGLDVIQLVQRKTEEYFMVFLDYHMPWLDGIETARSLRKNGYRDMFLVLLTGEQVDPSNNLLMETHFDSVMQKPITMGQLSDVVSLRKTNLTSVK
eukprot:TRINITY_DN9353_c0_g1_i2.p1 TRINITY_DN9353_c0_g1~~TRINITY_DN9353_c0_g1_i2.p1  ORF type:complete len:227 (+),score=42.21 TRINITY_DN9353_c0_g1_i2:274-954(+)